MQGKYRVITLCGSTRFKDEFLEVQKQLTLEGNIVISVGLFGHSGDNEVWTEGTKEMLDDMHKRKIDMADEIFVINVGGYIGASTASEIEYAHATKKPVRYLEPGSMSASSPTVEFIPAKSHNKLNWDALVFYVCQVPAGKCITDKNLLRFLRQAYHDEQLDFDYENRPFDVAIDCNIPLWRCLSATGMVQQPRFSGVNYKQKLLEEDHELVTKGNGNPVVSDYKKTEFDYSQLKIMPAEEALKPLVRWEIPSMKNAVTKFMYSQAKASETEHNA